MITVVVVLIPVVVVVMPVVVVVLKVAGAAAQTPEVRLAVGKQAGALR